MSNPTNAAPPRFDAYEPSNYDPSFTVQISESMVVPRKIGVAKDFKDTAPGGPDFDEESKLMNVPPKIILDGQFLIYFEVVREINLVLLLIFKETMGILDYRMNQNCI